MSQRRWQIAGDRMPGGLVVVGAQRLKTARGANPQVPVMEALKTYTAWRQANIPVELHVFQSGGHGFGALPQHKGSDQWLDLFDHWLRENGFGEPSERMGNSQR